MRKTIKRIALEESFSIKGMPTSVDALLGSPRLRPGSVEDWMRRMTDVSDLRIADMDENGVDLQVLSLTAPGIQGELDASQAVQLAKTSNDYLAGVIAEQPSRFVGLAALPLQSPKEAAAELERTVNDLGFKGALVNGHTNGRYLDETDFWIVWETLERLGVPLYLHPGSPQRDEWEVLRGYPQLSGPAYKWGVETGAHALRIIYSGVFDRFPDATLILGHMGEFLPFQMARLDDRYAYVADEFKLDRKPSEYISGNIVITTSGVCSSAALLGAILAIGVDSVLFAIDYPFGRSSEAVAFLDNAPISEGDRAKVAHLNAERVLDL